MIVLGLGGGLLTILVAGAGIALLAQRDRAPVHLLELAAVGWFFGTGFISLLLWLGGFLLSGLALSGAVAAAVGVLGLLGLGRARKRRLIFPRPHGALEWILVAAIALEVGYMFYLAFTSGLGWDGLLNWEVKARYAFLHDGVLPASYWSDVSRDFTHQSYPLWIPFTELWLYLWMGVPHQFWIKIIFPLFYAAGAVLLALYASRLTTRRWIGLLTAALLFFVPCLTNWPGGVQVGYADVPIAMLYLLAIGSVLRQTLAGGPAEWRVVGICLALLPWAKREGAVLWFIAALCAVLVVLGQGAPRRTLLWLLPGLGVILGWKFFYTTMGKGPGTEFLPLTWSNLTTNLPRAWPIARAVMNEMLLTARWSLFWPMVALAFAALLVRARDRRLAILLLAVAGPISIYAATYLLSSWPSWIGHAESSLSRLLLHVMPVAWLAIALALRPPASTTR